MSLAVVVALAAGVTACSASSGSPASIGGDASADSAVTAPGVDAGDGSADEVSPAPTQAFVRIAQLSPDSPMLDVCVAPHGTTVFHGPLVAQLAAGLEPSAGDAGDADIEPDAGAVGLSYAQVSAYVPLSPGSYDVRLVAAGAPSCAPATLDASGSDASSILVHDSTDLPSLAPGTYTTLLVAGDLSPAGDDASLAVSLLTDDAVLGGGAAALRAINASPSQPALDFGLRSSAQWAPLLTDVTFGAASAHAGAGDGTVDRDGYLPIAPLSGQAMSTRASFQDAGVDIAAASGFAIDQGSIATLIAIGGKTGDATNPPALLLCVDNEPSGGLLSDCSLAP